ncbi:MAG: hypothetical protein AB7T49_18385 [Oligoflexales bacterium]
MKKFAKMVLALSFASPAAFGASSLEANQRLCKKIDNLLEKNGSEKDLLAVTVTSDGKGAYALAHEVVTNDEGQIEVNLMIYHIKKDGSSLRMVGADDLEGFESIHESEVEVITLGRVSDGTIAAQYSDNAEVDNSRLVIVDGRFQFRATPVFTGASSVGA